PQETKNECTLAGIGAAAWHRRVVGRQIPSRKRTRLSEWNPSPGAATHATAGARQGGGAEHRRLHLGLSRLAAGRAGSSLVAGEIPPQGSRDRLSARRERRPGRYGLLGNTAGEPVPGCHA